MIPVLAAVEVVRGALAFRGQADLALSRRRAPQSESSPAATE